MADELYLLQGWDYYLYYLLVLYYRYIEFSFMIRMCAILLTFCLIGFVLSITVMTYNNYLQIFRERRVTRMRDRYGKIIDNILFDEKISGSFHLTRQQDIYLYRTRTRVRIQSNSSSSGGGRSGGGSRGGGGGKF